MSKRLDIRVTYHMMVTKVSYHKSWKDDMGVITHKFYVYFRSNLGEMYQAEFLTDKDTQNSFEPGMYARFKVSDSQPLGDVIVPLPDSEQVIEKELCLECIKPVGGESYSIAAGCAKDILANMQGDANDILLAFVTLAEGIDAWLIKKQKERIIG